MDTVLFESPWVLLFTGGGAALACLAYARVRGSLKARRALWGTLALTAAWLVVQRAVVTPRERLMADCREMARQVEAGDVPGVAARFSPRLEAAGLDRAGFIAAIERTLRQYRPEESSLGRFNVTVADRGPAIVEFEASCRVVTQREVLQRLHTKWRLRFEREGDDWRIVQIELLPIPTSPLSSLKDVLQ